MVGHPEPGGSGLHLGLVFAAANHQDLASLAQHRRGCLDRQIDALVLVDSPEDADHVRVRPDAELLSGLLTQGWIEGKGGGFQAIGDHGDFLRGNTPADEALLDHIGDGDRGVGKQFGRQVEPAYADGHLPPLDVCLANRVLGGHHHRRPRQPCRRAGVDLGPVQVGVHDIVAAVRDDRPQLQQGADLSITRHPEVAHRCPVSADLLGH